MVRPLRSDPITEPPPLLRVGPPADLASVLDPSRFSPPGTLPLATRILGRHIGTSLPMFLTRAADQVPVAFMPDTAWPIIEHLPDSSRNHQL
jgi:hypothetical protein